MSFVNLTAYIKKKLEGIAEIEFVEDYDAAKLNGYPAATFNPTEHAADFHTTTENLRSYIFTIRLYQEMKKTSPKQAEKILRELVDKVLDEFDKDPNLGGNCDWSLALPSRWGFQEREAGPVRVAELRLTCNKVISTL